jgi:hypothetical protein
VAVAMAAVGISVAAAMEVDILGVDILAAVRISAVGVISAAGRRAPVRLRDRGSIAIVLSLSKTIVLSKT